MEFYADHHLIAITRISMSLIAFFLFILTGSYLWSHQFEDRIAPNVFAGSIDIGGKTEDEARQLLQSTIDDLLADGIPVRVQDQQETLTLSTFVSSDLIENVEFDLDQTIQEASRAHRSSNAFASIWSLIASLWQSVHLTIPITLAKEQLRQTLHELFPDVEKPGKNARFVFLQDTNGWSVRTIPGTDGVVLNLDQFFSQLSDHIQQFDRSEIELHLNNTSPEVSQTGAEEQKDIALKKLLTAPIIFSFTDEHKKTSAWTLNRIKLANMLVPSTNGFTQIDRVAFELFLDTIALETEHSAQNARLNIEDGRVTEFVESKQGKKLDRDSLYVDFTSKFSSAYQLTFIVDEPTVQTSDVNDLGIDQILGVGTSSYRGSPSNRRKNIQNGVQLLNGILIPPGETFSLVDALKPFTIENGYLPELVIKGTKITPELGGGLCQIGTTTFRATMNTGLPIIERRNHSLVVSYYNDPSNNYPGTDATIYDPAPDFKFQNTTDHFILFQAENLTDSQDLRFTFWGTSDGRKGSYTPPNIIRWIAVGETQYIETSDLKPGEEKCQEAHIGADTTFDYSVVLPDGTTTVQTFDSHYRPLPRICLVGVEPKPEPLPLEEGPTSPVIDDSMQNETTNAL